MSEKTRKPFSPKSCEHCGRTFLPRSANHRFCCEEGRLLSFRNSLRRYAERNAVPPLPKEERRRRRPRTPPSSTPESREKKPQAGEQNADLRRDRLADLPRPFASFLAALDEEIDGALLRLRSLRPAGGSR